MTVFFWDLDVIRKVAICVLHSDAFNKVIVVWVQFRRSKFAFERYKIPLERRADQNGKLDNAVS